MLPAYPLGYRPGRKTTAYAFGLHFDLPPSQRVPATPPGAISYERQRCVGNGRLPLLHSAWSSWERAGSAHSSASSAYPADQRGDCHGHSRKKLVRRLFLCREGGGAPDFPRRAAHHRGPSPQGARGRIATLLQRHRRFGAEMLALDRMPMPVEIDRAASTVTVNPGMRYYELLQALEREGLAIHNTASLPHITVGGAIASATHGSGDKLQNLAGAVAAMELVTGDGDILQRGPGRCRFRGHGGACRSAWGSFPRSRSMSSPAIACARRSFSISTGTCSTSSSTRSCAAATVSACSPTMAIPSTSSGSKPACRTTTPGPRARSSSARALPPAKVHPVPHLDATYCTDQMGEPGPWCDRLPHFKLEALGDTGNEMQAEYMVAARERGGRNPRAQGRFRRWCSRTFSAAEFRSVAADDLWMSTAYQRETICLHYATLADPGVPNEMLPVRRAGA